jgi:hypothetical protein
VRKILAVLAVSAAALLPAAPAAAAPATASGCPSGNWTINNDASSLTLFDNVNPQEIVLVTPPADCWSHINSAAWGSTTVWEWRDYRTGECLYSGPVTSYAVVGARCVAGDGYEQWLTSFKPSSCCEWWINRGVTDFRSNGNYYYMTGLGNTNGSVVAVYGPGYGNEAIWYTF